MANYEVNPDVLTPYLQKGVELDLYNNKTYLSLVGFMFKQTSLFNIPIPFFGTFEEFKRQSGIKDSSDIMPGHGGFFDRIDSWIWGAPIGFYFLVWFIL